MKHKKPDIDLSDSSTKAPDQQSILKWWFNSKAALFDVAAWRFFFGFYRDKWLRLTLYVVVASSQVLLVLPVLLMIRSIFDTAIPRGDEQLLLLLSVGIFLVQLVSSIIMLGMRAYIVNINRDAIGVMRRDLVSKLYKLSQHFYSRTDKDTIHTQIVQDTSRVDVMSHTLLADVLPAIVTSGALLILLFVLDWGLVLAALCVVPFLWAAARLTGRYVKHEVHSFQRAFEVFSTGVHFVLKQMTLTRVKAYEQEEGKRQASHIRDLRNKSFRMTMSYAIHSRIQRIITGLAAVIILILGGFAIIRGGMSLGAFMSFFVAAGFLNKSLNTVIGGLPQLITGNESLLTLQTLMSSEDVVSDFGRRRPEFNSKIELKHVLFHYGDTPILRDISLVIEPHANLAIVGANGAGKSTIARLILGFYKPISGEISVDGISYDELDHRMLRRWIGVVPQHPTFFSGTLIENITYGTPHATRDDVELASRIALMDGLIESLPAGYDTQIGDDGVRLSGGECQRLALARALLGQPKLIIFDEPTNHLDAESVEQLMAGLIASPNRPAILTISHDSNVLSYIDEVYKLRDGYFELQPGHPGSNLTNALRS